MNAAGRKFILAEFFAGMGGLTSTMSYLGADVIEICATLDHYDGWNILDDDDFQVRVQVCEEVDHAHFAPPCRTLTRARRTDEYGVVPVLSDKSPERWGD